MRTVFLSAGHTNNPKRDMGAMSVYGTEGEETVLFRGRLSNKLKSLNVPVVSDYDDSTLSQSLAYFKNLTSSKSIVVDIHFNSSSSNKATGVEVLIPKDNTDFERQLGSTVSIAIGKILMIPVRGLYRGLRGIKTELESHHGRLGWMNLTGENILIEICFISNKDDMQSYRKNLDKLVEEVALILQSFSNSKDVTNSVKYQEEYHIVQPGDTLWSISRINSISVSSLKKINGLQADTLKIGQKLILK